MILLYVHPFFSSFQQALSLRAAYANRVESKPYSHFNYNFYGSSAFHNYICNRENSQLQFSLPLLLKILFACIRAVWKSAFLFDLFVSVFCAIKFIFTRDICARCVRLDIWHNLNCAPHPPYFFIKFTLYYFYFLCWKCLSFTETRCKLRLVPGDNAISIYIRFIWKTMFDFYLHFDLLLLVISFAHDFISSFYLTCQIQHKT